MKCSAIATASYDDDTLFEIKPAASLLDKTATRLLSVLGWSLATQGKKFVPFSPEVISLGVPLHLKGIWSGYISVANKPGRLGKISELLRAVVRGDEITKTHSASLHGLINFAGCSFLGYDLKPTARLLSKALSGPFLSNTR